MTALRADVFGTLNRIVIKVGTRILADAGGGLHRGRMQVLVRDLCTLLKMDYKIVLVSSGAVGLGMSALGLSRRPRELALKQACAAVGQIDLMHAYRTRFGRKGQLVAQLLLSGEDFRDRRRYTNIRHTVEALLNRGILPIINENDSVSTGELGVGDNDKLSSDTAHFLEADLLVILSDSRGLYETNPRVGLRTRHITVVPKVTSAVLNLGKGAGSETSVGGMRSKLSAIKQATEAGTPVVLSGPSGLVALVKGEEVGTLFLPNTRKLRGRKRWLAFVSRTHGRLTVDEGGVRALREKNSSLLAAGITRVRGVFKPGDLVEICASRGGVIGRGRVAYDSAELERIKGMKSNLIPGILNRAGPQEVVHRDHLVLF